MFRVFAFLVSFGLASAAWPASEDVERSFVTDVLFYSQERGNRETVVRWTEPLRIYAVGDTLKEFRYLNTGADALSDVLEGTGIELNVIVQGAENVRVVFAARSDFRGIMDDFKVSRDEITSDTMVFHWLNEDRSLKYALLLINQDTDDLWKRFSVLSGLTQVLGLNVSSPDVKDSLFYMKRGFVEPTDQMLPIDRKLLRFLYTRLEPGDGKAAVRRAFDAHWAATPAD